MGKFKPLLPLGNKTVIEQVLATFLRVGVRDIRVVLGYKARDVIALLENLAVSWTINDDYPSEMLTSVKVGADGLMHDSEAFFIQPVDVPLVKPQTLRQLMEACSKDLPQIIYPTFLGERGHPPLIPRQYAGELVHWAGNGGLKGFLEQYDPMSIDLAVVDEGVLLDMDTPEQYRQVVARHEKRQIPSKMECQAMMLTRFSEDHPVVKHSRVVAQVARSIGQSLAHAGCKMDVQLVEACGFLHDIGKGEREHARFGARLLKDMGYPNIAEITAYHIDLSFADGEEITEKEVLYLADKLVHGERILAVDKRLEEKMQQLSGRSEAKIAAAKRIQTAQKIEKAIEGITGKKIIYGTGNRSGSPMGNRHKGRSR